MIDDQKVIYLSFCIKFFKQRVNVVFQCALTFVVKRKIALASDVCFRPLVTIRSHNLHACDIEGLWVRQLPITKGIFYFLFFIFLVHVGCSSFGLLFLSPPRWF